MLLIRTTKIYQNEKRTDKRTSICKKTNWYLRGGGGGGKSSKRKKGGTFPFGIIASGAVPHVGEVVKPVFFNGGRGRRKRQ